MQEKIYEIAINDAFDGYNGCPICSLYTVLEKAEIESLSGGAVMQPDIRIKTNRDGLCAKHFDLLVANAGKLTAALLIQTHLKEVMEELSASDIKKRIATAKRLDTSCHACNRIGDNMKDVCDTVVYMFKNRPEFSEKIKAQTHVCPYHYGLLLESAARSLSKKDLKAFCLILDEVLQKGLFSVKVDIDYFCKKHDYRFKDKPWNGCENAVERAVNLLKHQNDD